MGDHLGAILQANDLKRLIKEGREIRLLDVRTPAEFESSHISGAYNVPLDTLNEHRGELSQSVQVPVVLICRSGNRARQAESTLASSGMSNLHLLEGGMEAWEKGGMPVIQGEKRWSLERQVRFVAGSLVLLGSLGAFLLDSGLMWLPLLVGGGLTFAALTDSCMMGMLLAKLPYNRRAGCDAKTMVDALKRNQPAPLGGQAL